MKKNSCIFLIVILLLTVCLMGCAEQTASEESETAEPEISYDYKVGYLSVDMNEARCLETEKAFANYLPDNYELIVYDAGGDADLQVSFVDACVEEQMNVIVLEPCSLDSGKEVILKAYEYDIPVIVSGAVYAESDIVYENEPVNDVSEDTADVSEETGDETADTGVQPVENTEESAEENISEDAAVSESSEEVINTPEDSVADSVPEETTSQDESSSDGTGEEEMPVDDNVSETTASQVIMPYGQVMFDYTTAAYSALQYVAENTETADILYCHCDPGTVSISAFRQGADQALKDYSAKIEMTACANGLKNSDEVYEKIMEMSASAFSHFNVIVIDDDSCLEGVFRALDELPDNGVIMIVAIGGSDTGYDALSEGKISADVIMPVCYQGRILSDMCQQAVSGSELSEKNVVLPVSLLSIDSISQWVRWSDYETVIPVSSEVQQ